ncbi:MAG: sensor domain-containing diguanylate cyclase [Mycobacteriales bacterium]|nr:sensor domain-containing diguanylate cyclase [Mycobacteriales bacterium]
MLSDFARTVLTDFSLQDILDHLVERVVELLPISAAGVTLISSDRIPHLVAASNPAALRFEQLQNDLGQGPCLSAYESGEVVTLPDLANADGFPTFGPAAVEAGMTAVFAFPLKHAGGCLGALDLYCSSVGTLGPEDLAVAQTLADVTTSYLLNAQNREQTLQAVERFRDSALHDPLTGLANRVLLQERLDHAAARASRTGTTTAVVFADLDEFKRINDTYGHAVGDEVLQAVAARLAALVRPGDTLARISGDEFVFLCEDLTYTHDVELFTTRIKHAFTEPIRLRDLELPLSASVGAAYAGPTEAVTNQLVLDADTAMYQEKGRAAGNVVLDLTTRRPGSAPNWPREAMSPPAKEGPSS